MIYLIFILIATIKHIDSQLTPKVVQLSENHKILTKSTDFDIYCHYGQEVSISNLLMSCEFEFTEPPNQFQIFIHQNESQVNNEYQNQWFKPLRLWSETVVTSFTIPSFGVQCIGINTRDSYKCQLSIKKINYYRLAALLIGLSLFHFGSRLSRNITFYYTSCVTIGVLMSLIIIFIIIGRYLPRKISGVIIMLGSSAIALALRLFWDHLRSILLQNSYYVVIYICSVGSISFALGYRFGPVSNPKTLDLIQWLLQMTGLILIILSSEILKYSVLIVFINLLTHLLPMKNIFTFKRKPKVKIRLLTEEEYLNQRDIETEKALEELKTFCLSPKCNAWKTINRLKDPVRFARFIDGETHINDEEISLYEISIQSDSMSDLLNQHLITDDECET